MAENREDINWESLFDETKRRFEVAGTGYQKLIGYIKGSLPQTRKNRILTKICERAAVEGVRIVGWYDNDEPAEFFAWTARNLFEINLITRYITNEEENLLKFVNRALDDIRDIGEGLKELSQGDVEAEKGIEEKSKEYEMAKFSLEDKMPWGVKQLAKGLGMEKEHKSFFKIYSKYVHPTPWLILEDKGNIMHTFNKQAFFNQGYIYYERVFNLISESTGFDETEAFKKIKYKVAPNG